jgi:hypothetical protein
MEGIEVKTRSRVSIRARESSNTMAAWRLELTTPDGAAVLVLAELGPGRAWYRGEGALLGAGQEKLAEIWKACLPTDDPEPDLPQYG